jgi:hypothetical protein
MQLERRLPPLHCCLEQQRILPLVVANLTATADAVCRLTPALADANLLS